MIAYHGHKGADLPKTHSREGTADAGWSGHGTSDGRVIVRREGERRFENMTLRSAKELQAILGASIDEAETVPRFSEEDIEAICEAFPPRGPLNCGEVQEGVDALRALRKPRGGV